MRDAKQNTPLYVERVSFSSIEETLEQTLGKRFGEEFHNYRQRYFHSLRAQEHGEAPDFPHTLTIELVNRCNLKCKMCYIASHNFPKSTLNIEDIKNVIDQVAEKRKTAILLGVGAEGLLYKPIRDVISYAEKAGIIDIILMTNGTLLTKELSEFLVGSIVSRVCISLDAAQPETYAKIRGKDMLPLVENNVRNLVEIRNKAGKKIPIVRVSFCVMNDNRAEQEAFRKKWESIVDYIDFQKLFDFSFVGRENELDIIPEEDSFCTKPFGDLNVWANGDISPCCTFYGKNLVFGNIATHSLEEVYNGLEMEDLRRQFRERNVTNKVCRVCMAKRENLIDNSALS